MDASAERRASQIAQQNNGFAEPAYKVISFD